MTELTAQQRRDIFMYRGFNKSYEEIAAKLAERHGIDVSDSTVGRVVREMEAEADAEGADAVYDDVVIHGYADDLLVRR